MKKQVGIVVLSTLLLLTGCSNSSSTGSKLSGNNAVSQVIQDNINSTNEETTTQSSWLEITKDNGNAEQESTVEVDTSVDIDLSAMDGAMMYLTVYQIMSDPNSYIGKTIKIKGNYNVVWYEPTAQYYHYVYVQDITACCGQGLEFVWGDGKHKYPEEYPQQDAEITVVGTFGTYTETGDSNIYCRLRNATMTVEK